MKTFSFSLVAVAMAMFTSLALASYADDTAATASSTPGIADAAQASLAADEAVATQQQEEKDKTDAEKQQACADAGKKIVNKDFKDATEEAALKKIAERNCQGTCYDQRNGCKSPDKKLNKACSKYKDFFDKTDAMCGYAPGTAAKIADVESSCNARDVTGKEKGIFQYNNGDCGGATDAQLFDPNFEAQCLCKEAKANNDIFQSKCGRLPTSGESYFMHQQGGICGANLMCGDPNANAANVLTQCRRSKNYQVALSAIRGNLPDGMKGLESSITAGQFASLYTSKFDGGVAYAGGTGGSGYLASGDTGTGYSGLTGTMTDAGGTNTGSSGSTDALTQQVADALQTKTVTGYTRNNSTKVVTVTFDDGSWTQLSVPNGSGIYQCNSMSTGLTVVANSSAGNVASCTKVASW